MNKFLIIPLLLLSFLSKAQFFSSTLDGKRIGEIYNSSFSDLSNWTVTGASDYSVSGGNLNISGTTGTDYSKYITRSLTTQNYRSFVVKCRYTVVDLSSNGFAIGFKSQNTTTNQSFQVDFNSISGTLNQALSVNNTVFHGAFPGATNLACSVNDKVLATITVKYCYIGLTIQNITAGTSTTYTFLNSDVPNTSNLTVFSLGGNSQINKIIVESEYKAGSNIIFIGDSQTVGNAQGVSSTNENFKYTYKVGKYFYSYATFAGNGDKSADVLACLPKILLSVQPGTIVNVLIGTNDFFNGVSTSTYSANITSIYNQLVAAGATVYFCKILPRNNSGIDAYNTALVAAIPSGHVIDTYTPMKGTGIELAAAYDSGDGLHENAAGGTVIANTIKTALGLMINIHSEDFEQHFEYIRSAA